MLKYFKIVFILAAISLSICVAGCNFGKKLPAGVTTMEKLKEMNKAPIEVVKANASKTVGNVATNTNPTVKLEIKNISDKKITMISWVIINIDKNGKLCKNWKSESGFAELGGIEPGESIEGQAFSSDPETAKVVVIIKDAVYDFTEKGYTINKKWTNSKFDAEIKQAKDAYK